MKARVLAEPVLVGRDRELEELTRCLNLAIEGKGNTVLVSGEAGSGKTRLANEFLKLAKAKGALVLVGWCQSNASVPYFPFAVAFDPYFSSGLGKNVNLNVSGVELEPRQPQPIQGDLSGLASWLSTPQQSEKMGKPYALSPQVWKDKAFAAVVRTLHTISIQEPIVLFLEDIHWADSASLALLHFISRAAVSERIFVLATLRSDELTADAEGRPHPLAEEMRLMRREDLFKEMKLSNLDREAVLNIAENMIGGTLDPKVAWRLAEESRGNSLFVVETLRMLFEQGNLIQENSQWRLAIDEFGIPSKIKDIILQRLAALKFNQRRVLDAASVIGEKFDVELLGAVLGQDSLEVLETLNVIAQSTSLVRVEESYFRFDHAKSQETLYEEIPLPLKRGYHARVAEKLESSHKNAKLPFSDLSYHYAQAGNTQKAVHYSLVAGEDALARFSNSEAVKHFNYVLQNLPDSQENAEKKSIALEGLGDAYYMSGLFAKALEVFERLADFSTGKVKLRAYRKAMDTINFGTNEWDRLAELGKKAQPYAASDRLESPRIRLLTVNIQSNPDETQTMLEEVLQIFEEEYSLPDVARTLEVLGVTISNYTRVFNPPYTYALSLLLRSLAMFEELGDLHDLTRITPWLGAAFHISGLLQETLDQHVKLLQISEKIGDYSKAAEASFRWGQQLELMGRFEEALSRTKKAAEYAEKTDQTIYQILILGSFVVQYARLGDIKHAKEYYEKLEAYKNLNPGTIEFTRALFNQALATAGGVFFAAKNQWAKSDRYFDEALKSPLVTGSRSMEWSVRMHYIWALDKQGRAEKANAQRAEAQAFFDEVNEKFSRVKLDASLLAPRKVVAGEEFEMRLDLVNVSRKSTLIVAVKSLVFPEFEVLHLPVDYRLVNGSVEIKHRSIGPFQAETVKLRLKTTKPGTFTFNPEISYTDEMNQIRTIQPKPITINVQPAKAKYEVLPERISTGSEKLDTLLFGGFPEKHAVALISPSIEEKELLIMRFLEVGATGGETTFHITAEAANTKVLAEKYPSNFYLFVCNPQADVLVQDMPNAVKLKGVENLTDIDIALAKAIRQLDSTEKGSKRLCIEIMSDVLLQHHAVNTRRWLNALLSMLKSNGFTILAVIDPEMHSAEETRAVLGLFDGEICLYEKETAKGSASFLKIKKMVGQKHLKEEISLT